MMREFLIAAVPSFLASAVEFVEATTIVLAVGVTRGWRAPLAGTLGAVLTLVVIIAAVGVALVTIVPEHLLQAIVGSLLLLFGVRWLRKAILRFAGIVALHDEELAYRRELAALRAEGRRKTEWDWTGTVVAYKAVLLEGIEVAFIVITLGSTSALAMAHATVGAIAAGVLVVGAAVLVRHPLTTVPENWVKFFVGAMLSSFGVVWVAEGVGAHWPGDALSIPVILALLLASSWLSVRSLRVLLPRGAEIAARRV